ncbi:MAG: LytTR family DNA-binding domain-containing protein [Bacteroidota bacterium]
MKKLALPKINGNGKNTYSPRTIICCEGDGAYTHVYILSTEAPHWRKIPDVTFSLGCFETWLYDYGFHRASKSMVVNLEYVSSLDREDGSTFIILEHNCCGRIKLGSKWRDEFLKRLLINPPD